MPMPRPTRNLEEVCSGLCCVQTDETSQAILAQTTEQVSARPMSEVRCTPRSPTGVPPALRDQVSDFEQRLQSFIALIMEQQYERLAGSVLESLRCSQQATPLRPNAPTSTGLASGGLARPDTNGSNGTSWQLNGKDNMPAVPADMPPLLKHEKSNGTAAQAAAKESLNPPAVASPKGAKLAAASSIRPSSGKPRKSQKAKQSGIVQSQEAEDTAVRATALSIGPADNFIPTDGQDSGRATTTGISDGTQRTRTTRTSQVMHEDTVLAELLHRASFKQREKQVQQKVKSKFRSKQLSRNSLTGEMIHTPIVSRILDNALFDSSCAVVIVLNSILIGFSVEWLTTHDEETVTHMTLGHICNVFFLVELTMRLYVHHLAYFTSEDWKWNVFDFSLVMFSIVDFLVWAAVGNNGAGSVGSTLKILKMLRIVRIFRVFRFFKELSLLALMIMDSLKSLVWALLMLIIIIYVFAICFTQNCIDFRQNLDEGSTLSEMDDEVMNQFGSLPRTIYSLVNAMLGGVSWGEVSDALLHMDAFSAVLFFFYISFSILAVLNIITGVFVDNAVETAKTEREFLIQKEIELREKLLAEMRELFNEMDEDQSGSVSFEELQTYFDDQRVQRYFQALGLDPGDAERLFRLIDTDGSGDVHVDEFLDGCLRLKGEARSIDVNAILWQCRQLHGRLDHIDAVLDSKLNSITEYLEPILGCDNGGDKAFDSQEPNPQVKTPVQPIVSYSFSSPETSKA